MPFSAIKPARLFLLPITLLLIFCRAYAQDAAPGFGTAMALNEPAARAEALQKLLDNQTDVAVAEKIRVELTKSYAATWKTQLVAKNIDQALQTFHKAIEAFPKK